MLYFPTKTTFPDWQPLKLVMVMRDASSCRLTRTPQCILRLTSFLKLSTLLRLDLSKPHSTLFGG